MAERLEQNAEAMRRSVEAMERSVEKLNGVTVRGADALTQCSDNVRQAADGMSEAGRELGTTLDKTVACQGQLAQVSTLFVSSAGKMAQQADATQMYAENIAKLVETLTSLVEAADSRASVSTQIVSRMSETHTQLENISESIASVLTQAFTSFSTGITSNTKDFLTEFDRHLSQAVGHLAVTIQELDGSLDGLVDSVNQRQTVR